MLRIGSCDSRTLDGLEFYSCTFQVDHNGCGCGKFVLCAGAALEVLDLRPLAFSTDLAELIIVGLRK